MPCQPFSAVGQRKGTDDERHLWPYVREAIRHLRPRYAFLENVRGHLSLGFDRVLGDLAEDGLTARWTTIRASDVGAPHLRDRIFILIKDQVPPNPASPGAWEDEQRLWELSARDGGEDSAGASMGESGGGRDVDWGPFAPAVRRWERVTRPAPAPTELNSNGKPRLNVEFASWMMGLPEGWVTSVPGLSRDSQLKALGNGVVPQQAAAALRFLLSDWEAA